MCVCADWVHDSAVGKCERDAAFECVKGPTDDVVRSRETEPRDKD